MNNLLETLEYLSRYGFIDILFGLGIGGIIISAFRKRTVKELKSVEVAFFFSFNTNPKLNHKSKFYISIENRSDKPLYIYQARFRFRKKHWWSNDQLPKMSSKSPIGSSSNPIIYRQGLGEVNHFLDRDCVQVQQIHLTSIGPSTSNFSQGSVLMKHTMKIGPSCTVKTSSVCSSFTSVVSK